MLRRAPRTYVAGLAAAVLLGAGVTASTAGPAVAEGSATTSAATAQARATNPVTPGNFTGYGFDQCLAPTQRSMNAWLAHSPFLSVGIYISGDSRACRSQPNLTPDWISTQLRKGWRLLPITLGPQASCSTRFPRYGDDETIRPKRGADGRYKRARAQGRAEAQTAVAAATALGIVPGSTLWYDLEGFDHTKRDCRESALAFLSAWTDRLHALDYVSGVYSSAGSGIRALDQARINRPDAFTLPDQLWVARWSGVPGKINDPGTTYLRDDGWVQARVHQYRGGHDETWGGVRINIDSNWLDVGKGSVAAPEEHCGGVAVDRTNYGAIKPTSTDTEKIRALQCLLSEKDVYDGKLTGVYNEATVAAVHAWQEKRGLEERDAWSRQAWVTLHGHGPSTIVKYGSAGSEVRRIQRALNSATKDARLEVTGVFESATDKALRAYQSRTGLKVSGVCNKATWKAFRTGLR